MFRLFADLIAFHIDTAERLALSEGNLRAERDAALLRERFIGVLGHDLRTPLGAVLMGAAELRETPLDAEQRLTVDMMERGALRMSGMIDDVTDLTHGRLGGGIPLHDLREADLEPVLRQVLAEVRAGRPGCLIEEHLELSGPVRCEGGRMAQLFTNLIVNAVVHGTAGTPVRIRATGGGAGGSLEFRITNAAEEIAPEVLEGLFEPFSRGAGGSHRGGLGLGLYIASQIAKSHGGTLTVRSAGGEICFICTLPQA